MNTETARKCFDALSEGDGWYWDCRVLARDGLFKANAIQLAEIPEVERLLKRVENHHVWELDLTKYSKDAVLQFLCFVYLSQTDDWMSRSAHPDLAAEIWCLAKDLDFLGLQSLFQQQTYIVDEGNFQSAAQLAAKMNSRYLLLKCSAFFKTRFAADPASAITELREQAPAFLQAAVLELPYRIPVADNIQDKTEQGVDFERMFFQDNGETQVGLYKLRQEDHEALLRCNISHHNALELLGIAVMYKLNELKAQCLGYVFDNRQALLTTAQWKNADNTVVQAVVECVFLASIGVDSFCVYDYDYESNSASVCTVDMNGTKSRKIEVDSGRDSVWDPLIQLNDRTVMVLLDEKQGKLFDLIDHSVEDCSPLLSDNRFGSACLLNGDVYVCGGYVGNGKICERYNRTHDTWQRVADMNKGRSFHALVVWKGSLLAIGGAGSDGSIERYDAVADEWEVIRESQERLGNASVRAAVINNELWVYTYKAANNSLWKLYLDEWVEISLPHTVSCVTVVCMFERNGMAHLITTTSKNDCDDEYNEQTDVFSYDEATGVWSEVLQIKAGGVRAIPILEDPNK